MPYFLQLQSFQLSWIVCHDLLSGLSLFYAYVKRTCTGQMLGRTFYQCQISWRYGSRCLHSCWMSTTYFSNSSLWYLNFCPQLWICKQHHVSLSCIFFSVFWTLDASISRVLVHFSWIIILLSQIIFLILTTLFVFHFFCPGNVLWGLSRWLSE